MGTKGKYIRKDEQLFKRRSFWERGLAVLLVILMLFSYATQTSAA
jgi:hypothetical protein